MSRRQRAGTKELTSKVDASEIEAKVGRLRHQRAHFANAVSSEQTVYILHSKNCLEDFEDLRDCPFSLALDYGIDLDEWTQDQPTLVAVYDGVLRPARIA